METTMPPATRRDVLRATGLAAAASVLPAASRAAHAAEEPAVETVVTKGRINQSVCRWCYKMPLPQLAAVAKKIGLKSVELLNPNEIETVTKLGLQCAIVNSHSIPKGLNRKENWDECLAKIRTGIDAAAQFGCRNVICFSGNRDGMDGDTGLKNCAEALKKIVGYAEEKKVTIIMELLNSRVDHRDYMCDNSEWGVALCKAVGSERFKLLNDLYHMQIMEGDLIRRIQKYKEYYGHYHTGGNPGRHEIDDTQEIYYPAVMRAIAETGYDGYVGQEFIPSRGREPAQEAASLAQAAKICDV
jgi:hydroxypyruvate isomerase